MLEFNINPGPHYPSVRAAAAGRKLLKFFQSLFILHSGLCQNYSWNRFMCWHDDLFVKTSVTEEQRLLPSSLRIHNDPNFIILSLTLLMGRLFIQIIKCLTCITTWWAQLLDSSLGQAGRHGIKRKIASYILTRQYKSLPGHVNRN